MDKVAYVLSGGGAKGAFQVGVMQQLESLGINPDVLYGTSVGALNAAGYAYKGLPGLYDVWSKIKGKSDILSFNWWSLLLMCDGFYSTKPLSKLIDQHIQGIPTHEAVVCLTNLNSGLTEYISNKNMMLKDFQSAVLASASIPMIMRPVGKYVDGGVRMQTPLIKAIKDGAKKIYLISCNPIELAPPKEFSFFTDVNQIGSFLKFYKILGRSIEDIMEQEILVSNILIGVMLAQKMGVEIIAYAPSQLLIDTLSFDPISIKKVALEGTTAKPINLDFLLE